MNLHIGTADIAERFRGAMGDLLEKKPAMLSIGGERDRHREPKFEGHVESRRPRCGRVEVYIGEIVK